MTTTSTIGTLSGGPPGPYVTEQTRRPDTSEGDKIQALHRQGSFRPLRKALGVIGTLSIVVGTLVVLGVLAFLVFLWTGEGPNEGERAMPLWRMLVLDQRLTQVVTLSAVVLRFTNTLQASVCTGLVAALILEKHGVPLRHLAEFSMIRSINDGPFRITWLLSSHPRRYSALMTFLVSVLLLGSLAVQFTSTILLTDLGISTIVGDTRNDSRGIAATFQTLNQIHLGSQYMLKPVFVPFGEVPGTDPSPNERGISDTGVVRRAQPFVPRENRTTIRHYRGLSLVLNSRMVCLRPVMNELTLMGNAFYNPAFADNYIPFMFGSISYSDTFRNAGIPFPEDCPDGSCFPSKYNCSVAVQDGDFKGRPGVAGCIPSGRNAIVPTEDARQHQRIRPEPIASSSEVFIFTRSNLDEYTNFTGDNTMLPSELSFQDEWSTYKFEQGKSISMSLCFQQLHYDRSNIELQTNHDLTDGSLRYIANTSTWDTSSVTKSFGSPDYDKAKNPAQRGIYAIKALWNATYSTMTERLTYQLISESYQSYHMPNVSIALSPYGGGDFAIMPHVEYQALFADTLAATNRPGVALQNLITALSGSVIDSLLSQLDYMDDIETVSSVSVPAPRRRTGLIAVLLIHAVNVATVIVIVSLYLVGTECSSQGNYWHAIAQIMSEITEPVLHRSSQATDDEVAFALRDYDAQVKVSRTQPSGRVQLVRCDDAHV